MYFFGSPFSMHVCHVQNHVARSVVSTVHGLTLLLALAAISTMAIGLGPASQGYPVVNGGSDLERLGYSYALFFMGSDLELPRVSQPHRNLAAEFFLVFWETYEWEIHRILSYFLDIFLDILRT